MRDGKSILDHLIETIRPLVTKTTLVGNDPAPGGLDVSVLNDFPGVRGPLAGILAALHSDPSCDWLTLACDMPGVSRPAIEWLISHHQPAKAATFAVLSDGGDPEPLLAIYTPGSLPILLEQARHSWTLRVAARALDAHFVQVPAHLASAWCNVNTPDDWNNFCMGAAHV